MAQPAGLFKPYSIYLACLAVVAIVKSEGPTMNFASCDRLLLSCHSWLEFTNQLKGLPTTTDQGDVFERLVQIYMLTDPEYVSQFEQVWHATSSKGELPSDVRLHLNLPLDDEGIDLIALSRNGEYTSIQAKYRTDPGASISWGGTYRIHLPNSRHLQKHSLGHSFHH